MIEVKEIKKSEATANSIFSQITSMKHEQVVFCYDHETGLKAIIAIHNTNLGHFTRRYTYVEVRQ